MLSATRSGSFRTRRTRSKGVHFRTDAYTAENTAKQQRGVSTCGRSTAEHRTCEQHEQRAAPSSETAGELKERVAPPAARQASQLAASDFGPPLLAAIGKIYLARAAIFHADERAKLSASSMGKHAAAMKDTMNKWCGAGREGVAVVLRAFLGRFSHRHARRRDHLLVS